MLELMSAFDPQQTLDRGRHEEAGRAVERGGVAPAKVAKVAKLP